MKTLVVGASENPARYSFKAIKMLRAHDHEVIGVGLKAGVVGDVEFNNELKTFQDIDTVTLYVGPQNQLPYFNYICNVINPRRVIFNPGTENIAFQNQLKSSGIEVEIACTLVLLSTNQY